MKVTEWPTVTEAAAALGVSGAYLRKLLLQGKITGVQRGRTWLLDPEPLQRLAEQRKQRQIRKQHSEKQTEPA